MISQNHGNENKRNDWLRSQQAATYLKIKRRHLLKLVRDGKIRAYKPTNKLTYFLTEDLDNWIEHKS